ncbi:MAG TPA: Ppx/GppA phosphatase family protein [Acidimicrobiia bacterium]|nr:Ppx/GppA phosphatase family protein [Acidimicrobiia bacterium]
MRIAALDLGTNSFHLLIADVHPDGSFTPLAREKEMLRLGDSVSREGFIPPDAEDVAVATVRRMKMLAEAADATEIVACATSAIRLAANGDDLVDRIERETGVKVDVINGLTEARLIFGAIRASVLLEPAPALCFDLGGGSLEVMVGTASELLWATSENLGVARLTADFVRSDPSSKADRRALRDHLTTALRGVAREVRTFDPKLVVGSSGTLEDLAAMVVARRGAQLPASLNQLTFTRDEFLALHDEILASKASERRRMVGLEPRRVDLIVAGSMFLATAMDVFEFDEMTISEWALREGILLDAIGHHDPADWTDDPRAIRRASVQSLARRCSYPEAHSKQVARLALELFDQTAELHGLDADDRELLEYAALLHDIGEHVAHDGHHRHAAYLIQHGGLRGFAPEEVALLAALARWHRRGEPRSTEELGPLGSGGEVRLRELTAFLRIADGLDRSRSQAVDHIDVNVGPSLVMIRLSSDRDTELEQWGARRKRDLFEKVFNRELEVTAHPSGARAALAAS